MTKQFGILRALGLAVASAGMLAFAYPAANAADYVITASGPLLSVYSFSDTFNGTDHGELPPLLDVDRLTGGTFNASFRFSTVTPPGGYTSAYYDLSGTSAGMTFDLFDAGGQVVHHKSDSSGAEAIVANNNGSAPYIVDQVLLVSINNGITGLVFPTPLYTPPGEIFSVADFNFGGYVGGGVDYVTDLSIPIDAATYLAFPSKFFDVVLSFADGDVVDMVNAYQSAELYITYEINSLSVTAVPEPSSLAICGIGGVLAAGVRRRKTAGRSTCSIGSA